MASGGGGGGAGGTAGPDMADPSPVLSGSSQQLVTVLPDDVVEKLAELDLELSEGDITQKGYEKKRKRLLEPYMRNLPAPAAEPGQRRCLDDSLQSDYTTTAADNPPDISRLLSQDDDATAAADLSSLSQGEETPLPHHGRSGDLEDEDEDSLLAHDSSALDEEPQPTLLPDDGSSPAGWAAPDPPTTPGDENRARHKRKRHNHHEKRYHSEVRQEAVQQALAAFHSNVAAAVIPVPSTRRPTARTSRVGRGNEDDDDDDDEEDDEEDCDEEEQNIHSSDSADDESSRVLEDNSGCGANGEDDDDALVEPIAIQQGASSSCSSVVLATPKPSAATTRRPAADPDEDDDVPPPPPLPRLTSVVQQQQQPLAQNRGHDARRSSHRAGDPQFEPPGRPSQAGDVPPLLPSRLTESSRHRNSPEKSSSSSSRLLGDQRPPPPPHRPSASAAVQPDVATNIAQTNVEPYDVLFLNKSTAGADERSRMSTPDVALQSQMIHHRMRNTADHNVANDFTPPPMLNRSHNILLPEPEMQSMDNVRHPRHHTVLPSASSVVPQASSSDQILVGTVPRWKVSAKIQQLLNTLKKPRKRQLEEFYEDDDIELELAAKPKDPNAPVPEGGLLSPAIGHALVVPSGLPRSLEAAIQRYGSATYKAPAATVLDANGKPLVSLSYGKLLSRSYKIAYALLNRIGYKYECLGGVKPGDRVALVYPNNDPISFMTSFYGCLIAGVVPVPIEVPITKKDAGSQQIGFLLGSCHVGLALTSDSCYKGLPRSASGEVVTFKGWPKLQWFVTEHLPKPPKEWQPPPRLADETIAYVEYTSQQDGSVLGVGVSRSAMLSHAQILTNTCNYTEGEIMVCVLDFKRETGLWHAVFSSVFNGMHVIFVPYSVMKVNPASWMQMVTRHRASVAICKSRDLHWGLLATKDHRELNLSSLRLLLVADGANPWSLSSCDQFLAVFQVKGLRQEAMCPSASSSEALTVSLRRPGREGSSATGRGVLSMSGLSHGVVRVDQENSLTSLTLQDCGQVLPGSTLIVLKADGCSPVLCKTDEVGEIAVRSTATGSLYWGLSGLTATTFRVKPCANEDGGGSGEVQLPPNCAGEFVRTGLLGFLGPGGLVFVCGSRDGLMCVTGRKHNTDDIIATVLAVEPMKFIYRGRIAVFSIKVLRDERICVVAEQRPECTEEESFQWMSRVLQAVDSIHQVGIYCLALVPHNHLPKTPLGGIHLAETRRKFIEGTLHPANVLMCPHTCVTNLPKPRELHPDVGPASVIVGNLVQGNRLAAAKGRDVSGIDDEFGGGLFFSGDEDKRFNSIADILKIRSQTTSDHLIYTLLNHKGSEVQTVTCFQLHKRAERISKLLQERDRLRVGDHVALVYPPGLELISAFYGCLYSGLVPVTIRPPHPQNLPTTLPTVKMIVDVSKAVLVLSISSVLKLLKSREAGNVIDVKSWPSMLDSNDVPKRKSVSAIHRPSPHGIGFLDFSVSTTGMLAGIKMSHASTISLCRAIKLQCELYPSRHVALCLDPYCGLGFALWCLSSVFSGHHTILIPPVEVEINPSLWLTAVSQYKVRDTFCSYGVIELCTKGLGGSVAQLKARGVNLACVRTCVVVAEERPRISLTLSFTKLFSGLNLSPRAVSTSFGCRVNTAICLQGASCPDPTTVYVDLRALRNDRVTLTERGAPHSIALMESGKLLPGVGVIIANPDTKGQCGDSHLGEIWVQSPHNANGYHTIYGDDSSYQDHFSAKLVTGSAGDSFARTGYIGFLRRTEAIGSDGDFHDALFIVGSLDETLVLRGMRYHPIDIENSVMKAHKKISECAVFTWTNLLVVVAELDGPEAEALDLVPLITNVVLEEHHLIVGIVVVADPGTVPINSRGEKQRMHLRDGFLADQLDPIYVAYNM